MNNNQLITTNQNSKQALVKSKNLLDITKKLLEKKDDEWLILLFNWASEHIIQERTLFPKSKEELLQIKHLSLRWNRLSYLPKELFNLTQLERLELNNNALETLPDEIGNLKNLKELNLNINSLKKIPKEIIKLKKIEILNIKNNKYLELEEEHLLWLKELKIKGCEIIHDKYKFNLGG